MSTLSDENGPYASVVPAPDVRAYVVTGTIPIGMSIEQAVEAGLAAPIVSPWQTFRDEIDQATTFATQRGCPGVATRLRESLAKLDAALP